MRTVATLSTNGSFTGEAFEATLAEPLIIDGRTLATRGARLNGIVAESNPGGRVADPGSTGRHPAGIPADVHLA